MNFQETISAMLKREVTEEEAKKIAIEQFGMLTTFIRENDKEKENLKNTLWEVYNVMDIKTERQQKLINKIGNFF